MHEVSRGWTLLRMQHLCSLSCVVSHSKSIELLFLILFFVKDHFSYFSLYMTTYICNSRSNRETVNSQRDVKVRNIKLAKNDLKLPQGWKSMLQVLIPSITQYLTVHSSYLHSFSETPSQILTIQLIQRPHDKDFHTFWTNDRCYPSNFHHSQHFYLERSD